jgi:hypothetical protein
MFYFETMLPNRPVASVCKVDDSGFENSRANPSYGEQSFLLLFDCFSWVLKAVCGTPSPFHTIGGEQ